jgi:hypothetical protein
MRVVRVQEDRAKEGPNRDCSASARIRCVEFADRPVPSLISKVRSVGAAHGYRWRFFSHHHGGFFASRLALTMTWPSCGAENSWQREIISRRGYGQGAAFPDQRRVGVHHGSPERRGRRIGVDTLLKASAHPVRRIDPGERVRFAKDLARRGIPHQAVRPTGPAAARKFCKDLARAGFIVPARPSSLRTTSQPIRMAVKLAGERPGAAQQRTGLFGQHHRSAQAPRENEIALSLWLRRTAASISNSARSQVSWMHD